MSITDEIESTGMNSGIGDTLDTGTRVAEVFFQGEDYSLGDFVGAVDWFNQAAERLAAGDVELGARMLYNRGMVRYVVDGDRKAAIADVQEALKRKPDYPQAQEALRGLRGKMRWVPW